MGHRFDSRLAVLLVYSATYIANCNGCFRTSGQAYSIQRKPPHNVSPERHHPNPCQMMHPRAVMWKAKTASLSNLCRFLKVSLTFQGPSCLRMIFSDTGSTRFRVWFTFSMIVVSYHVEDRGRETMVPHSLIFRKVAGKPFANSVLTLCQQCAKTLGK